MCPRLVKGGSIVNEFRNNTYRNGVKRTGVEFGMGYFICA